MTRKQRRNDRTAAEAPLGPFRRLLYPFQRFFQVQASSGILLLICTAIALIWANSPFGDIYRAILDTKIVVGVGERVLAKPVLLWINDGLMAIFFFVVGLEIKRELIAGELADGKRAALPVAAALGGMVAPAAIYSAFNIGGPDGKGWGVPIATDIAFAIGVLALLGSRVPAALKVFLTALAIVDDIGAVVVIAIFYGHQLHVFALLAGVGLLLLSVLANVGGLRAPVWYALIGVALWLAFLLSGVHATVAGVLLAFTIPASIKLDGEAFRERVTRAMEEFGKLSAADKKILEAEQQAAIGELERACEEVQPPVQRMEHILHPWVSYGIMPIFALANAGVQVSTIDVSGHLGVPIGVGLGLLCGKPLGIWLFSWVAVRMGWATKPEDVTWRQIFGVGMLGGIGFTMALFIAGLAFPHPNTLSLTKVSILASSATAGIIGYATLARMCPKQAARS